MCDYSNMRYLNYLIRKQRLSRNHFKGRNCLTEIGLALLSYSLDRNSNHGITRGIWEIHIDLELCWLVCCLLKIIDRLGGVMVERPPRLQEVVGSIPVRVIQNTLNIVVMAVLLGAQSCWVSITTDWLVSG